MALQLTQHASIRANQRGIPHGVIAHLLDHADVETRVGSGCVALSLSRRRLKDRDVKTSVGRDLDRLRNLAVVCDPADGSIITVLHEHGARARRYHRA